jgi:hypothetical protein
MGESLDRLYRSEFSLRYTEFALSSWIKQPRREADHTPPRKVEVENERNCTSTHIQTMGLWEWGEGLDPLYRSEFSLRYIEFALSSWIKQPRREADHTPPWKVEVENEWNCTSTHIHTAV